MRRTHSLFGFLLLLQLSSCGSNASPPQSDDPAGDLRRTRASTMARRGSAQDLAGAWEAIEPLVTIERPRADDLVRAAIIAYHKDDEGNRAATLVERARVQAPDDLSALFVHGNILLRDQQLEAAADAFRLVVKSDPGDAASRLQLATALEGLDDTEMAIDQLRAVRDLGLGPNGSFYVQATYRLGRLLIRLAESPDDQDAAIALLDESSELKAAGVSAATMADVEMGRYGVVLAGRPAGSRRGAPTIPAFGDFTVWDHVDGSGVENLLVVDLGGDAHRALIAWGSGGAMLLRRLDDEWTSSSILEGDVTFAALGDLDDSDPDSAHHHPTPELVIIQNERAALFTWDAERARFVASTDTVADTPCSHATFVDLDHNGSLDLVLAGPDGLSWWRNDGSDDARFFGLIHTTLELFDTLGACRMSVADDVDDNQAIDLIVLTEDGIVALAGLWDGVFVDRTRAWGLEDATLHHASSLHIEELNGDGRPDLIAISESSLHVSLGADGGFAPSIKVATDQVLGTALTFADLTRNGFLDVVSGTHLAAAGPLAERDEALPVVTLVDTPPTAAHVAPPLVADLNDDGVLDLVTSGESITIHRGRARPDTHALTLRLAGRKDNTHGVGAIVELLAGGVYQRRLSRGEPLVFGLGAASQIDVLNVRWTNGVNQTVYDHPSHTPLKLVQVEGLVGSCPFVYAWDGKRFSFVTDVLGTTPLGLPMEPGKHVPFDHEEYVRLTDEQLVVRDGALELVITEELREVTYLDRVRLHAVDHPSEIEVHPNESFTFPPFPPHHIHTLSHIIPPASVTASNGTDVTTELATIDGDHAQPFVHRPAQYHGLTEPWHLDLTLASTRDEVATLARAPRVRLAMTGWLLWTDASVNVSAARHPTIAFEPPQLWTPDGASWERAGPPIGFPAGKTKTMLVDITDLIDPNDPRLRLSTTLALSWDAIRLVLDDDDAPYRDTPIEASSAQLAWRGFSEPLPDETGQQSERFDWDRVIPHRWDQHPGMYTRYGDVLPLLGDVDDRTVIFGAGDALALRFDAEALPALPEGWTRDWLLYLDGWAKDRDPNTTAGRRVEPLPFHAMSDYPPPASEAFPDTPEHRAWRASFNTRPARPPRRLHDRALVDNRPELETPHAEPLRIR